MCSVVSLQRRFGLACICIWIAIALAAWPPLLHAESAADTEVRAALEKANVYIEVAKRTERASDSWDRYASWVNMKTGPTGKERYISYGMYEVHEMSGLLTEARAAAAGAPANPKLDATMMRYLDTFDALAPVLNRASDYYDRKAYLTDGMVEGKALHTRMVPLAKAYLADRSAMMKELRIFVRDVEHRQVAAIEGREGKSSAWQVAHVMHAANRVLDTFPRDRPATIDAETLDEKISAIGPTTPGAKLDELITGVVQPTGVLIDMARFNSAMQGLAEAVEGYDRFAVANRENLKDMAVLPRQLLDSLQALQKPLARSEGRDFEGSGPLVGRVIETYFSMLSTSRALSKSQLHFLE